MCFATRRGQMFYVRNTTIFYVFLIINFFCSFFNFWSSFCFIWRVKLYQNITRLKYFNFKLSNHLPIFFLYWWFIHRFLPTCILFMLLCFSSHILNYLHIVFLCLFHIGHTNTNMVSCILVFHSEVFLLLLSFCNWFTYFIGRFKLIFCLLLKCIYFSSFTSCTHTKSLYVNHKVCFYSFNFTFNFPLFYFVLFIVFANYLWQESLSFMVFIYCNYI